MLNAILPLLAVLVLLIFFVLMFVLKTDKNKLFVQYILLAYPLIASTIIPGGMGINNFDVICWAFLLFFYKRKKTSLTRDTIYLVLLLIIIIIGIIGCILAESLQQETVRMFIELFATFIFAKVLIDEIIHDPSFFYQVIKCLKITLIVSLAFLACQFVFGVQFSLTKTLHGGVFMEDTAIRYPGFFQDPQKFAQFLAGSSFLFLIRKPGEAKLPVKNYIFLVLTLVAILYTGGRAAFGGWALGFFLIVIFGNSNLKLYAVLIGIAMFTVIYNFSESFAVFNRHDNLSDSYDFRYGIWKDAFGIFLDNPYFGIAPGNYSNYVSVHNPDQYWFIDNDFLYYDHPESGYLKWLTEFGAIGFISILLLLIIPMVRGFFSYLKWKDTTYLLLISAIISWMVGFYTIYSIGDIRIQIFITVILSLLITADSRFLQEEEVNPGEDNYAE